MFETMTEELVEKFSSMPEEEFRTYLFLEPHPDFPTQWRVNSDDPTFQARMGDTIRSYRAVAPFAFDGFMEKATAQGYKVLFLHDPSHTFEWLKGLNDEPEVEVNSTRPGTVKGLFPFQVQGYNFAKRLMAAVLHHSTGTGKTVTGSALTKYHQEQGNYDISLWVVKEHNRINTQRALKRNVGLDSLIIDGTPAKRAQQYAETAYSMDEGQQPILVTNYEKLRDDLDFFKLLVTDRKVLIIWDEMPTKLRNRTIKLYRAVAELLYTTSIVTNRGNTVFYPKKGAERPSELRQIMLSATPIENHPMDWFNCIRMLDTTIYGSVKDFENTYVESFDNWNTPVSWHRQDMMGDKAAHIVHQVDKNDPDIAVMFPEMMEEEIVLDMDKRDRKLYDRLTDEYRKLRKKGERSELKHSEILAAIGVLQMLCNNPRAVLVSGNDRLEYLAELDAGDDEAIKRGGEVARKLVELIADDAAFTDADQDGEPRCSKLLRLRDDLEAGEKTVIFTAYNSTNIPYIQEWLDKWGVQYVTYTGTKKQKQEAEDRFRDDPQVQVFLSSDKGSDSINLEMATLGINYDLPWKWSTKTQRENRLHRITSTHKHVRVLTYTIANSVEDRRAEIIERKRGYDEAVLKGTISEQSFTLRAGDYLYILTGEANG